MRFLVGLVVLAAAGSASAGILSSRFGRSGYGRSGIDWDGWLINPYPVHEGGSILSIPGDILTAIKIVFRSLWKIITLHPIDGIRDLIKNAINLIQNIFDDIIGRPHGINPLLQDCNGMLTVNQVTGLAECRPYENLSGTGSYGTNYQNVGGAGYQIASAGYGSGGYQAQAQYQSQRSKGKAKHSAAKTVAKTKTEKDK